MYYEIDMCAKVVIAKFKRYNEKTGEYMFKMLDNDINERHIYKHKNRRDFSYNIESNNLTFDDEKMLNDNVGKTFVMIHIYKYDWLDSIQFIEYDMFKNNDEEVIKYSEIAFRRAVTEELPNQCYYD